MACSVETGLVACAVDLIFHYEHHSTRINCQISHSKQATLEWSAFAGCFSVAKWQSIRAAWGPNGSLWMAVNAWLHSSVVLNKAICYVFPFV